MAVDLKLVTQLLSMSNLSSWVQAFGHPMAPALYASQFRALELECLFQRLKAGVLSSQAPEPCIVHSTFKGTDLDGSDCTPLPRTLTIGQSPIFFQHPMS